MSKIKEVSSFNGTSWGTAIPIGADDSNVDITGTTNPTDTSTDLTDNALIVLSTNNDTDATAWTKYNRFRQRVNNKIAGIKGLNQAEEIPSQANLNTYLTPGVYYSPSAARSVTLPNCPVSNFGFTMLVAPAGSNGATTQILWSGVGNYSQIYIRRQYLNSNDVLEWYPWHDPTEWTSNENLISNWYLAGGAGYLVLSGTQYYSDTACTIKAAKTSQDLIAQTKSFTTMEQNDGSGYATIIVNNNNYYVKQSDIIDSSIPLNTSYKVSSLTPDATSATYTHFLDDIDIHRHTGTSTTTIQFDLDGLTIAISNDGTDNSSHYSAIRFRPKGVESMLKLQNGQYMTASILLKNEEDSYDLYTGTITFNFSDTQYYYENSNLGISLVKSKTNQGLLVEFYKSNTTYKLVAVKLEIGKHQTLAHKENGVWVLNDPVPVHEDIWKKSVYIGYTPTEKSRQLINSGGIYTALRKEAKIHTGTITFSPSAWDGNQPPYEQTVTVQPAGLVTANSMISLQPTANQYATLLNLGVTGLIISNNNAALTASCFGAKTDTSMTIQCTVTEVTQT